MILLHRCPVEPSLTKRTSAGRGVRGVDIAKKTSWVDKLSLFSERKSAHTLDLSCVSPNAFACYPPHQLRTPFDGHWSVPWPTFTAATHTKPYGSLWTVVLSKILKQNSCREKFGCKPVAQLSFAAGGLRLPTCCFGSSLFARGCPKEKRRNLSHHNRAQEVSAHGRPTLPRDRRVWCVCTRRKP